MTSTSGTCFGFAVATSGPMHFLRGGTGQALDVRVESVDAVAGPVLREWAVTGKEEFHARLHHDGSRYGLWVAGSGWYVVDPTAATIVIPPDGNAVKREERLWGVPAILSFRARGRFSLHAAAVELDGEAVLLAAPGTFGKTTLAAAFALEGYRLLTEDVSCLALAPRPSVVPGPAMLRLRADVADRLRPPSAHELDGGDDRLHLALDPGERGDCTPVPLRAIVLLRPHGADLVLEPAVAAEALRDLYALSFRLPGDDEAARSFAGVGELVRSTPVWNLAYPLGLDRVAATVQAVVARIA